MTWFAPSALPFSNMIPFDLFWNQKGHRIICRSCVGAGADLRPQCSTGATVALLSVKAGQRVTFYCSVMSCWNGSKFSLSRFRGSPHFNQDCARIAVAFFLKVWLEAHSSWIWFPLSSVKLKTCSPFCSCCKDCIVIMRSGNVFRNGLHRHSSYFVTLH